jgi:hypothetical protein
MILKVDQPGVEIVPHRDRLDPLHGTGSEPIWSNASDDNCEPQPSNDSGPVVTI